MRKLLYFAILLLAFSSCKFLTPNIMLQTGKNFKYSEYKDSTAEYKLSPYDIIEFRIYTNDGFKLVDLTSLGAGINANTLRAERNFTIEFDGYVKLPVIGRVALQGFTVRQAELMLEEKYASVYVKPFVLIKVVNNRVIIFPGSPGAAKVIPLDNNTTLMEAIAVAGGISNDGKAWKIKVIRNYSSPKPQVYLVDLSTINGLNMGGMVLQANDIVYIEPRRRIAKEVLGEITPVLTLITSLILTYALITRNSN
jgi:polysaccharide biosynthesis/export protein